MTPYDIASVSEASQQRALFAWIAQASKHGFYNAYHEDTYKGKPPYKTTDPDITQSLVWAHAIKNQEKGTSNPKTNAIRGAANKAEGVIPGVADVFWPKPIIDWEHSPPSPDVPLIWHGIYIEMKKLKGGVISQPQRDFRNYVLSQGYMHKFAIGWIAASLCIVAYAYGQLTADPEIVTLGDATSLPRTPFSLEHSPVGIRVVPS